MKLRDRRVVCVVQQGDLIQHQAGCEANQAGIETTDTHWHAQPFTGLLFDVLAVFAHVLHAKAQGA